MAFPWASPRVVECLGTPLTMSHSGAIRQHSATRGEAPLQKGARPDFPSRPHGQQGHSCNNAGGSYLRGSHSLKGAEEGKAGLLRAPGRERPSRALERGKKGLSTPSEVPSVTPVRGEGEFEGEGGFGAPPSPSRQKWLQKGLPGSLEGLLRAPWLPSKTFLTPKAPERGKQRFQNPRSRSLLKSPR